mgnify:CR=1 FL=1
MLKNNLLYNENIKENWEEADIEKAKKGFKNFVKIKLTNTVNPKFE